jgi:hypothetical protein
LVEQRTENPRVGSSILPLAIQVLGSGPTMLGAFFIGVDSMEIE